MRAAITSILDVFPTSPAALAHLAAHDLRARARHRLRRHLTLAASSHSRSVTSDDDDGDGDSPLFWFLALRVEFAEQNGFEQRDNETRRGREGREGRDQDHRHRAAAAAVPAPHRWRGTFERALAAAAAAGAGGGGGGGEGGGGSGSRSQQQTPLLWRCYLSAEIAAGEFAAARRIFLRAGGDPSSVPFTHTRTRLLLLESSRLNRCSTEIRTRVLRRIFFTACERYNTCEKKYL